MGDFERIIEAPAEKDIPLSAVFNDGAFRELAETMRSIGWEGVDEVCSLWTAEYSSRPLVSGFLKDKTLGAKRFMSMPDRFTNTVDLKVEDGSSESACRPSVINNYVGDLSSFDAWWASWKLFMFETPLQVIGKDGPLKQIPYQMLSKIPRAKYPALSEEEERLSLPLQALNLALFDAALVHIMNTLSPSGEWLDIKRRLCEALFVNKQATPSAVVSCAHLKYLTLVLGLFRPERSRSYQARATWHARSSSSKKSPRVSFPSSPLPSRPPTM